MVPGLRWRQLYRARSLDGRGDFGGAAVICEALVRADPSHAFAAFTLADCYEQQSRFSDALHWAEVAAAQMPDPLEALQSVARLAVACGDHEKAATCVVRTLSLPEVRSEMPSESRSLKVMTFSVRVLHWMAFVGRRLRSAESMYGSLRTGTTLRLRTASHIEATVETVEGAPIGGRVVRAWTVLERTRTATTVSPRSTWSAVEIARGCVP